MPGIPPDMVAFGIDYSKCKDFPTFVKLWALEHKPVMAMNKADYDSMPDVVKGCTVILKEEDIVNKAPGPHQRPSGLVVNR
jgi:hypothetical protein